MRLIIDESLSRSVAAALSSAGHDAVHVGELGLLSATDKQIMSEARSSGRTVVSVDTDFGDLLALGQHPGPSVVLLRRAPHRPSEQASLLELALAEVESDLEAGAVVILSPGRVRIRRLPIDPGD